MANLKRNIINITAATVAVLFIIGALNMGELASFSQYISDHTNLYMASVFYTFAFLLLFLFPIVCGLAIENWMFESNTRIGWEFSNAMTNARDGALPFIAVGLFGGIVTLFASLGVISIICG